VFISHLASTYASLDPRPTSIFHVANPLFSVHNSANEFTVSSNKKTIMPADVFKALEDTEFGFMKERLEAEFASESPLRLS